jgi:hypothetical protein
LGEKQTGGLGDTGESTDEVKIANKKQFILQHFIPVLTEIFADQWGTALPDLTTHYTDEMEADQQHQEELLQKSESKQKPGVPAKE